MKVLISGGTGFIGAQLVSLLVSQGHEVIFLTRRENLAHPCILWNPKKKWIPIKALEGLDAVIHLAGENIAQGWWTKKKQKEVYESRVLGTSFLVDALCKLQNPPKHFLSASAIGYYDNQLLVPATEQQGCGTGFLAELASEWEKSTWPLFERNIRAVSMRLGVVLGKNGGILSPYLFLFKWGLGGYIGSKNQYMSWIDIEDAVQAILFLLTSTRVQGPVNITSPFPVTNQEFAQILSKLMHRPAFFNISKRWAKFLFGRSKAEELLLSSIQAVPEVLLKEGFRFTYPSLINSLTHQLK